MNRRTLIESSAALLGGRHVFAGTRVPVITLFDYLDAGEPLDEFLDDFPTVGRGHAEAVLALVRTNPNDAERMMRIWRSPGAS